MIAIVDYGVGNLFSLLSSLRALDLEAEVTGDAGRLRAADRIILPGVGAFGDARAKLDATGLVPVIQEEAEKKPLLGICLGMQLLFDRSFEYGEHPGLGLVPGQVVDLRRDLTDKTLKVPHMGWNSLQILKDDPLFRHVRDGEYVYYVHSFYARDCAAGTLAASRYGNVDVTGVVRRGNVYGTQFHPEKSGDGTAVAAGLCRTVREDAMRPMRRQDRAVTAPEKIRAVIDACEVCRLGLQDGRGVYVVPVNFGHTVEGGRHVFYFHGAAEGRKVDLVRRNGWAGFELDTGYRLQGAEAACGYTAAFQSVIGEGPIRVVETAEERRRGLAAIMRQATCCGDWTFPDAAVDAVCVLRLDAEELSCKEHL